jgi:hypothetical protein
MTAEQFTYWLQGYAELNDAPPTPEQWQAIRDHLALVFNKVTPDFRTTISREYQWPKEAVDELGRLKVTCAVPAGGTAARAVC